MAPKRCWITLMFLILLTIAESDGDLKRDEKGGKPSLPNTKDTPDEKVNNKNVIPTPKDIGDTPQKMGDQSSKTITNPDPKTDAKKVGSSLQTNEGGNISSSVKSNKAEKSEITKAPEVKQTVKNADKNAILQSQGSPPNHPLDPLERKKEPLKAESETKTTTIINIDKINEKNNVPNLHLLEIEKTKGTKIEDASSIKSNADKGKAEEDKDDKVTSNEEDEPPADDDEDDVKNIENNNKMQISEDGLKNTDKETQIIAFALEGRRAKGGRRPNSGEYQRLEHKVITNVHKIKWFLALRCNARFPVFEFNI
ncbi:hypothetical protein GDO86_006653 [Hymenochirus boettgeri]|uniref:Uncharacterized protein n=1 Tax=Hymenochirus boettgeri TaxID=247094 RepID=A0A8T2J739_9PIPI|nr:hypothetical protein GDO86_006653 [Hymenochirus boettgeri]